MNTIRDSARVDPASVRAFLDAARERALGRYPFLEASLPVGEGAVPGMTVSTDGSGTITGTIRVSPKESAEWGDSVEVAPWALWVAPGNDAFETLRALYAEAFRSAPNTAYRHVVYADAGDRAVMDALVSLGFGMEQAYASRPIETALALAAPGAPAAGIRILPLAEENRADIDLLSDLVIREHAAGPTWSGLPETYEAAVKRGFSVMYADPEAYCLMAYEGEVPVGYQCWFPESDAVAELSVGAVVPGKRGRGVGTALFLAGLAELARRGYTTAVTDWRTANLSSSRFWPKCGFTPYLYRFVRRFHPYQLR